MSACESCHFWQPLPAGKPIGFAADRNYQVDEDGYGICRRYPPRGLRQDAPPAGDAPDDAMDAAHWAQWPVTSGDIDWCGEYRGK